MGKKWSYLIKYDKCLKLENLMEYAVLSGVDDRF
jgi:hypothetical protein